MDELNQTQNPNMTMPGQPAAPAPVPAPMPQMPVAPAKKKSFLLWIVMGVALAVAGGAWWYISQMAVEPIVQQQPDINQEARIDTMINKDIQSIDDTNLDSEFKTIDADIDSL